MNDARSIDTDVLVVGAGIAGLCAAIGAAPRRTLVITPVEPTQGSSSALAQGGIAAPLAPDDSVELHVGDTLAAADHSADPPAVERILGRATDAIRFLETQGVAFDAHDGRRSLHLEAGHRRARVAHAEGDRSGAAILGALWRAARAAAHVDLCCGVGGLRLLRAGDGRVHGIAALGVGGEPVLIHARETVLATGGLGRLYRYTTNGPGANGDGLAMALDVGARTAALEFVQFHPTALRVDSDPLPLLTEALRGAGARLVDASGAPLMAGLHPLGDLAPRDTVARVVWEAGRRPGGAWLDARSVFATARADGFPAALAAAHASGLDPARDLLPVTAAAHYHMGGVVVDADGRASVPGLWACGEVAQTGLHGANRLASNSLLEAVVCGRATGAALSAQPSVPAGPVGADVPAECLVDEDHPEWSALRDRMWQALGPVRDGPGLRRALADTDAALGRIDATEGVLRRRLALASAMFAAALRREESRGAHWRSDFPDRDARRDGRDAVHTLA